MNENESIVSLLQEVQAKNGYIPKDEIYRIAAEKGVSPAKVTGVATFYSQFRLSKPGKNLILLCKGTACHVNSADGIAACQSVRACSRECPRGIDVGEEIWQLIAQIKER